MSEFAARIRRVRVKNGADVHVLHNPMPDELDGTPENWRGKLIEHAKAVASQGSDDAPLDGYIVIGLFADGMSSVAFRVPQRIPSCLVPAYVAELMRRDAITENEAERVFDQRFEWVE